MSWNEIFKIYRDIISWSISISIETMQIRIPAGLNIRKSQFKMHEKNMSGQNVLKISQTNPEVFLYRYLIFVP